MAEPTIQIGGGNWAGKSGNLLGYYEQNKKFYAEDFTFSRSTSGTRVNSSGLIETASVLGSELVVNGDFASDSDWTLTSSANITNGKLNVSAGAFDFFAIQTALVNGNFYKISIEVTVTSGSVLLYTGGQFATITSSGVYNYNFTSDSTQIRFRSSGSGFVGSIDNVSVKEVIENNIPRVDYLNNSNGSLILEPQSTNTVTYSENFSQWGESGSPTLTIGQLAPDGTLGATKISGTIGSSYIALGSSSSTTATRSIYARTVSGTGTAKLMSYSGNTNNLFTLTEEWQRFELTGSSSVGGTSFYIDLRDSSQTLNEFIVWGAQSEELSYATSYIPSNSGSSVTRNQDTCSITNIADRINSSEGVLFGEIAALAENEGNRCITISANSSNKVMLRFATLNRVQVFVIANGTLVSNELHTLTNITNFNKIAFKYKSGNNELFVNGVKVDDNTDTFTFTSSLSEINFDEDGGSPFYGKTKQIQYYNTALTDQELITLTTL